MNSTDDMTLLHAATDRWFQELADRGIFTTDTGLVIRSWNGWLEQQTGVASKDVVGRPIAEALPSIAARGLDRYYADALAGEVRVLSERFHRHLIPISRTFHTAGVTEMAQSARIAPLLDGGRVIGTITVIDDVTERVVHERELRNQIATSEHARRVAEEASRLKDEFLATMSHEIRTPLNAVLGWSRLLRTQPNLRSKAHALDVIERNAAAQLRLVEDLLDMARIISGKLRLDVQKIDFGAVATAAIEVVLPAAEAKNIELESYIPADLPAVNGDADRLQQVSWNLVSNAVKFTDSGGTVRVTVAAVGDRVVLTVSDTGQGIAQDFLPYVFDRFRQADASPSRRHGGLGLGLALVRHITELHGGTVGVDSAGPGRGATFSVSLPAASGDALVRPADGGVAVTLDGLSVMIVDDNQDGRELLVTALTHLGAEVRDVPSAEAALAAISDRAPDVLVSDLGMPDMDGYELIRRVRALSEPAGQLPAIAVTAYANPEERIRALVAGYQSHLPKPVDPSVLAATIAALVGRPDHRSRA